MNRKPLTYDSLRAVLQYMDANFRLKLALHLPSVRTAEKSAPMKIEKLEFRIGGFVINETEYSLGIYQKRQNGPTPPHILENNKQNLSLGDIDQYGFYDRSGRATLLPGDVALQENFEGEMFSNDANKQQTLWPIEEKITKYENDIAYLQSLASDKNIDVTKDFSQYILYMKYYNLFRKGVRAQIPREHLEKPEVEAARRESILEVTKNLEINRSIVQPYYNRRDGVQSPFDNYIQFMVKLKGETLKAERVEYTFRLCQAEKSLYKFVFRNRRSKVIVKNLQVDHDVILRVPHVLKFKIQELIVDGCVFSVLEGLAAIIDESSYPLEVLKLICNPRIEQNFNHPEFRNAKFLVLDDKKQWNPYEVEVLPNWGEIIRSIVHPRVHRAETCRQPLQNPDFIALIRTWIAEERQIGTIFTYGGLDRDHFGYIMQDVAPNFAGYSMNKMCVTIPMNEFSKLSITCVMTSAGRRNNSYVMKFEVVSNKAI